MAEDFDLTHIKTFEVQLISTSRHCCRASQKLQLLIKKAVELKLNNELNITCKDDIDLNIKNILDDAQNIRDKLTTIKTSVDSSDKAAYNLEETVNEFESIVNIVTQNKNTIFTHRNLL